jgi:hypothetical protein
MHTWHRGCPRFSRKADADSDREVEVRILRPTHYMTYSKWFASPVLVYRQ